MGYDKFVEQHVSREILDTKRGVIKRYPTGQVMSEHSGIHQFTYGQGKGLGMTHHEKLFVVKIDASNNDVWVGDEKYLFKDQVDMVEPHWLSVVNDGDDVNVKIRYSQTAARAKIFKTETGYQFHFESPQRAVTPGQAAVVYRDKELVGGGWITL
jgi:tRNA-specific 2-thiouridylase